MKARTAACGGKHTLTAGYQHTLDVLVVSAVAFWAMVLGGSPILIFQLLAS
jgi:hypothetical protein